MHRIRRLGLASLAILAAACGAASDAPATEPPGLARAEAAIDGGAGWSWRWRPEREGELDDMYQNEHDALFASIRAGEPIDDGDTMCNSTLMALMGRMSAYSGRALTWEQAWNSQEDLRPAAYAWGPIETAPVARPGVTQFV